MTKRSLRHASRSPNASLAAFFVIAGSATFACSSAEQGITGDGANASNVAQAINGESCDQVSLEARRDYKPSRWTDGDFSFSNGSMSFKIPGQLPVIGGAPGNAEAYLTFGDVTCTYRGDGLLDADQQGSHGGSKYVFESCSDGSVAGATASASHFHLHVDNGDHQADGERDKRDSVSTVVRVVIEELRPCDAITRGEVAFHDRSIASASHLGGNGRACADCHVKSDHFQLSPATAEARFQTMTTSGVDDPLFRPIDANDFRTNGDAASDYTNLRKGLVRVTMPLPPNVKLVGPDGLVTTETFVDVWRSVPTVNDVAFSGPDGGLSWPPSVPAAIPRDINGGFGPNRQGGYQLDARAGDLESQALGAFIGHSQITGTPSAGLLSDIAAFQRAQVSAPIRTELNSEEAVGKVAFDRICKNCHGGAVGTVPLANQLAAPSGFQPRYGDITTTCPRPNDPTGQKRFAYKACNAENGLAHLAATVRTYEITMNVVVNGVPQARTFRRSGSDPGRFLLTGYGGKPAVAGDTAPVSIPVTADDWAKFDISPLAGIKNTAPYFHNNSAATLEDVVDHYEQFFLRTWYNNPNAPILSTTGPTAPGVPNPDRLFGLSSSSCKTTGAGAQAPGCPIPFGPGEKQALVAYLKTL